MVVLSIKTSNDGDGFLYETTAPTPISELIPALVNIYNGRLRARTLVDAVGGLAAHGIMKPVDDIGSDEVCMIRRAFLPGVFLDLSSSSRSC